MRRMLTIALVAALAGRAIAGDPPVPGAPLPSSQSGLYPGGASSQTGSAGSSAPGTPGGPGQSGATNPDGTPMSPTGSDAGTGLPGDTGGTGDAGAGAGAGAGGGGFAPGLGGFAGASGAPTGIIGDLQPITQARIVTTNSGVSASRFPHLPTPLPPPHVPGGNTGIVSSNGTTSILFKLTGLKISDNQSPIPQDRFFYSFNYFDNLNASVDRHQLSPISNLQVYHQLFGIEKTFLDGRASIGIRVPLNTISLNSSANVTGLGGTSTAPGDLSIFLKYVLYQKGSNLISTGFQVTPPTGPGAFGGKKYYSYFRDTQIQPFVGYLFQRDRFYAQGFTSIDVPTTSQDVTLLFNDVGIGYYVYRAVEPNKFLTAIVPTAEIHVTTPLNHRGFSATDLASTPDIVNMTFGTNVEFRRRAVVSVAYVTPVTGPKPFNAELALLLNIKFGGSMRNRSSTVPPIIQ
jgi:hypothetical protein